MLDVFRKIFSMFSRREKRRFFLLTLIMLSVSIAELAGISSILFMLNILTNPEMVANSSFLSWFYDNLGFISVSNFNIFLSFFVFFVVLLAIAVKACGSYAIVRFSAMRGFTMSKNLLEAYLHQPYTWFLNRNTSDISKNVLNEIKRLVSSVIVPSLKLISSSIVVFGIVTFLLILEPFVTIISSSIIGIGYFLIYWTLRPVMTRLGKESVAANTKRFRLTQEATGGFKELKLLGIERQYVNRFVRPSRRLAAIQATNSVIQQMPKFGLEAIIFASLLGSIVYLQIKNDGDLKAAIPVLGTFAFAMMRLMPAVQNVYQSLTSIKNGKPLLDHIYSDYMMSYAKTSEAPLEKDATTAMSVRKQVELRDAYFSYPNTEKPSLDGISLVIPAETKIGIVGGTGAGKTTLVDTILCLLTLQSGRILVDGEEITAKNAQLWRNSLGYVPQTIYLTDSTVAENIAFGFDKEAIDMAAVERAAKTASLHDFVVNELPDGYQTVVGERGVRLSGGQRQRIGIARALYHDPALLIFDEATSALDNLTEREVMEAINRIGHKKTIVMIAHRLTTVRDCDTIYLLEKGRIAASGSFDELKDNNETFRSMAANM
ncbi:ABC transporter ATP-binding protein [Roseovarius aestuariivivens]|uniref:ABC transporter ATP-binding protein n=1 Tax=Roseovarius aestuariivivens TaxID=1888910 RepID=UPI001081F0D6|nr:ABC transporter ATP-binding protein [Roseovarius aestuariivivens]